MSAFTLTDGSSTVSLFPENDFAETTKKLEVVFRE